MKNIFAGESEKNILTQEKYFSKKYFWGKFPSLSENYFLGQKEFHA